MLNNKQGETLLQGQAEAQTGNKEKLHNKESKIFSNMKLKFINPSRRRRNNQTKSRK
jgi:hypothetical protein